MHSICIIGTWSALSAAIILPLRAAEKPSVATASHAPFQITLTGIASGKTELEAKDKTRLGRVSLGQKVLQGQWRFDVDPSTEGALQFEYRYLSLTRDAVTPLPKQLQRAWLGGSVLRHWGADYYAFAQAGASLAGTGGSLGSRGAGVDLVLLVGRDWSPTLRAGLGVMVETYGEEVIPLIDLEWKFADGFDLTVGFPRTAVSYHWSGSQTLFAGVEADIATFHHRNIAGQPQTISSGSTKLDFEEIRAMVGYRHQLLTHLTVEIAAGGVIERGFEYQANRATRKYVLDAKEGASAVSLTVSYRF